jgi:putative DNA primase/helicase
MNRSTKQQRLETRTKLDGIPSELKNQSQWILWKYEKGKENKTTKIPYRAMQLYKRASSTDHATWNSFANVTDWLSRFDSEYDGAGFVFAEQDPFTGVDLDWKKYRGDGIPAEAKAIIDLFSSYTEYSPSGRGCHIIIKGNLSNGGKRKQLTSNLEIEIYSSGRYFTMTGNHVEDTPVIIADRQRELEQLYSEVFAKPVQQNSKPPRKSKPHNLEDSVLLDRAMTAKNGSNFKALWEGDINGYSSHSEADLALCNYLHFWGGGDGEAIDRLFRQSGLMRDK